MTEPSKEWLEKWFDRLDTPNESTRRDALTAIHAEVWHEAYETGFNEGSAESKFVAKFAAAKARRETLEEVRGKIRLCEETSPHDDVRFINDVKNWLAEQLKEAADEA